MTGQGWRAAEAYSDALNASIPVGGVCDSEVCLLPLWRAHCEHPAMTRGGLNCCPMKVDGPPSAGLTLLLPPLVREESGLLAAEGRLLPALESTSPDPQRS